jgi:hypothetical protein
LSVASLANLCEDLEVSMPKPSSSLAKIGPLSSKILVQSIVILRIGGRGRRRVLGFKLGEAVLAGVHVGEEIIVVVEEICKVRTAKYFGGTSETYKAE